MFYVFLRCYRVKKYLWVLGRVKYLHRGIFRADLRTEVPDSVRLTTARYVSAIKSVEEQEERYKEKYVVDGHLDIMKHYFVFD